MRLVSIGFVVLLSALVFSTAEGAEKAQLFERDVMPLMVAKCFDCHSSRADEVKGGLKLDSLEELMKGGTSGTLVVPGDIENSLLLRAIRYQVEDMQMPPSGRMDDEQIALFEAWVKSLDSAGSERPAAK